MMLKKHYFCSCKKEKTFQREVFLPLLQKINVIINLFNKELIYVQRKRVR
jgi:hypothetical protein